MDTVPFHQDRLQDDILPYSQSSPQNRCNIPVDASLLQSVFACVAAPVHSFQHFLHGLAWIWVHQLQCNVSNQYSTGAEDAINRPWRPIPAGLVNDKQKLLLRWGLPPFCIALSAFYGWDVAAASAALTATTIVYDEFSLAGHWIGKNACNIGGYVSFEIGATKIMGQLSSLHLPCPPARQMRPLLTPSERTGENSDLDFVAIHAVLCSAFIIFTTIQSQDFADVEGDASIGRVTFPIYAPEVSRIVTLVAMIAWSVYLTVLWDLGPICGTVFCALGAYIGYRFYALRGVEEDKSSYRIYNVSPQIFGRCGLLLTHSMAQIWLFMVHLLPAQGRWMVLDF